MKTVAAGPTGKGVREPELQFQDLETQRHAVQLGMWIFLAGEVLLFSAMFALYGALRAHWPEEFARGASETVLWMGTTGTVLLLLASFLVAVGVHAVRHDRARRSGGLLWWATALGLAFLALKLWEYAIHFREGLVPGRASPAPGGAPDGSEVFWALYYVMTGAHAFHVLGGILLLGWLGSRARRGHFDAAYHVPLEAGGMYWHLVDVIWLFVWPFFYLLRS